MTWSTYRELVLVGMEKIAAEYEQLQERASNDYLTPNRKNQYHINSAVSTQREGGSGGGVGAAGSVNQNQYHTNSSIPTSREGSGGGVGASGSANPSQRQRRHVSHDKLPH